MKVIIEKADGGFILNCEKDSADSRIFVKLSDVIDYVTNYFDEDFPNEEKPQE